MPNRAWIYRYTERIGGFEPHVDPFHQAGQAGIFLIPFATSSIQQVTTDVLTPWRQLLTSGAQQLAVLEMMMSWTLIKTVKPVF